MIKIARPPTFRPSKLSRLPLNRLRLAHMGLKLTHVSDLRHLRVNDPTLEATVYLSFLAAPASNCASGLQINSEMCGSAIMDPLGVELRLAKRGLEANV